MGNDLSGSFVEFGTLLSSYGIEMNIHWDVGQRYVMFENCFISGSPVFFKSTVLLHTYCLHVQAPSIFSFSKVTSWSLWHFFFNNICLLKHFSSAWCSLDNVIILSKLSVSRLKLKRKSLDKCSINTLKMERTPTHLPPACRDPSVNGRNILKGLYLTQNLGKQQNFQKYIVVYILCIAFWRMVFP